MIKITKLTDIWESEKIPKYIAESMEKLMLKICKDYLTLDISSFGAFYFIENVNDLDRYAETGMTERIEDAEPELFDVIADKNNDNCCFHTCYVIDTDYAIYVFCEYDTVKATLSNRQDNENSSRPSSKQSQSLRAFCSE